VGGIPARQGLEPDQETLIALGKSSFDGTALAQVRGDNLAERIATVLDERRRIGEIRRQREREHLLRQAERAQVGEPKRGELKGSTRLVRELAALCEAVSCSNSANDAMKECGILDAVADTSGTEKEGAHGNARI
jgi:hypothetical protein